MTIHNDNDNDDNDNEPGHMRGRGSWIQGGRNRQRTRHSGL